MAELKRVVFYIQSLVSGLHESIEWNELKVNWQYILLITTNALHTSIVSNAIIQWRVKKGMWTTHKNQGSTGCQLERIFPQIQARKLKTRKAASENDQI